MIFVLEYPDDWKSLHQCLLMLFDSPLNKAGFLHVYIRMDRSEPNKMVNLHPEIRIPRTFKRFQQLFANFLSGDQMPLVDTKDGQDRLMTFVNKRFSDKKQLTSIRIINLAPKVRNPKWFSQFNNSKQEVIIFVQLTTIDFNILGDGRETDYEIKTIELTNEHIADNCDCLSLGRYPISPALMCVKLTSAFEEALDIL